MTGEDLRSSFGSRVERLPGRWIYHGAYAEQTLAAVPFAGHTFRALFQMNADTELLQQVLLEARPPQAKPAAYLDVVATLRAELGAPDDECLVTKAGGEPLTVELIWRFPTTAIHASFLDFNTTSVLFRDPRRDIDPLVPHIERRRIVRRFLPRRIAVRFHPSDRADLFSKLTCERMN